MIVSVISVCLSFRLYMSDNYEILINNCISDIM